jgi:hypothetical protein
MPQGIIESFSRGLDTRRSILTSSLGVLQNIVNCAINQGGEIEKRKSFVGTSIVPTLASGVSTTFGIEALKDNIVIYGGEANLDSTWPPAPFIYQRLYRPATNATPEVKATEIVFSTAFNGKTFAIANMADGVISCFYDGTLVGDINYFGRVMPTQDSLLKLYYSMLLPFANATGFTAALNNANPALATGIRLTGAAGKKFSAKTSGTGIFASNPITAQFKSDPVAGTPASASSAVLIMTQITVGGTPLLSASVGADKSPAQVASDVTAGINAYSGTSGYTAKNDGNSITITSVATGASTGKKVVEVTVGGAVFFGSVGVGFSGKKFTLEAIGVDGFDLLATSPTSVDLLAGGTIVGFVNTVAARINLNTATHGWIAMGRQGILRLGKKVVDSVANANDAGNPQASNNSNVNFIITQFDGGDIVNENDVVKVYFGSDSTGYPTNGINIYQSLYGYGRTKDPLSFRLDGGRPPYFVNFQFGNVGFYQFSVTNPGAYITHIVNNISPWWYSNGIGNGKGGNDLATLAETAYVDKTLQAPVGNRIVSVDLLTGRTAPPTLKISVTDADGNNTLSQELPINFVYAPPSFMHTVLGITDF